MWLIKLARWHSNTRSLLQRGEDDDDDDDNNHFDDVDEEEEDDDHDDDVDDDNENDNVKVLDLCYRFLEGGFPNKPMCSWN